MASAVSSKVLPLPAPLLDKEGQSEVPSGAKSPPPSPLARGEESKTAFLETALGGLTHRLRFGLRWVATWINQSRHCEIDEYSRGLKGTHEF